jgi:inhibitor of KinA sporulation pathway (predicted exonuclease)
VIYLGVNKMNYIVFDLEFNQAWDIEENESHTNSKCPFEIIQIGAVQLDEKLQVISTFDNLVKPELYTSLHPFVRQLTGITTEKLTYAKAFKDIFIEFTQFINSESILCTWGISDMKELLRNIKYHRLDTSIITKQYINIQPYVSKYLNCPKGTNVGLRNAAELLNIPLGSKFHNALNDAFYTSEIFRIIYSCELKTTLYHPDKESRFKGINKKTRLDTDKLIAQFEKMYTRQMTQEEQAIIQLAYMMGRTNQFQSI